jgi:two-component system CheB/CheR fusion protein
LICAFTLLANVWIQPATGGRAVFLPFYPAVMAVGFLSGAVPGAFALIFLAVATATLWMPPIGSMAILQPADRVAMLFFLVVGGLAVTAAVFARGQVITLQRTRARFSLALSAGRMALWDWDIATDKVSFSDSARSLFGASWSSADEMWSSIHPADRERVTSTIRDALASSSDFTFTARMQLPGRSEIRWLETHGKIHRDVEGTRLSVTGVTVDVTEKQRAIEDSRTAELRFEVALRGSSIVAWACDTEKRYTWVYNQTDGLQPEDLIGRKIGELLTWRRTADYDDALDRVLASGRAERLPIRFERDGEFRYYLANIDPITDESGRVVGLVGAYMEITDIRRTEEALRRSEEALRLESRRKDEFLAILAHELRNPLAPARYALRLLDKADSAPPEALANARRIIDRQLAHMGGLLDDLLDVARITRNAIEIRHDYLDLRAVVEAAVETARPLAEAAELRLEVRQPPYSLPVRGDAMRLNQVLVNLLNNAAKYSDPGGHIHIESAAVDGYVTVRIEDNGIGISAELLPRIFDLFTRGPSSGRGTSGLGIGLTVANQIVALHRGRINVASAGTGMGSRFTVEVPRAEEMPALGEPLAEPDKVAVLGAANVRVLIVDDNADAADSLAQVLGIAGYQVKVAYEGFAALEAAEMLRPDIILLDIGLPNLSGHDIARRIRGRAWGRATRLIAITGWGSEEDRRKSREAGFDAHLTKPADPRELLQLLAQERSESAHSLRHRG